MLAHEYIEVNGIKLHVAKKGAGDKLVVLLHGWPEFWYTWRKQIDFLSEKYTVVAPDLRGFNLSDKPKGAENYTSDIVAKDIAELISKLGFQKAFIVGHDWGGAVAWTFATLYPELTEKLAVLNCPHPKIMSDFLRGNFAQIRKSWYMFFFQLPWLPERFVGSNLLVFFKKAIRAQLHDRKSFTDEDVSAFVTAYEQKGALTGSINYYRALRYSFSKLKIYQQKIKAPVLLIWGENDMFLGKEMTEKTANFVENSYEFKPIPNCSHWVQNDCPNEVNAYLLEFFKA